MPRRASSLTNISNLAVSREIDSKYDVVKAVAEKLPDLETFLATDTDALIASLNEALDFTGITVESGALANWDASTKVLTVPTVKGDTGDTGATGATGAIGPQGATGARGAQGAKGDKGDMGAAGSTGPRGLQGDQGHKGDAGADLTIEQIGYDGNGMFTWQFSDGTSFTTPDLRGDKGNTGSKGDKGDTGTSVHHTKGTSTTDPEGDFTTAGARDTYTMYGNADETLVLGWFTVQNGWDPYDYAVEGGYTGTRDEFNTTMSSITDIETASQLAQWRAEANEMTTDSFANEAEDVEVRVYVSNDDGTFSSIVQTGEYSALHYKIKTEKDYHSTLALGNGYAVANNTEKDALTELTTADTVFVSDDGDGKWARYQVIAVTDGLGSTSTFEVIMDEDTYLNANTAIDIKTVYESNADTNAYTDAEKVLVDVATALDTTAVTLPQAVNEIHGEVDAHIADTEDAHDASAISHIPGDNTYAVGDELQTVVEQIDTELEDQDNRLDILEDVDTVEGSVLKSIKDTAENATFTPATNTYATGTSINIAIDQLDAEVVAQDGRLDILEEDVNTDGSVLNTVRETAKDAIYDNTISELAATTLNVAIDELDNVIDVHKASTGEDHTYIDQDVTTTATPTFAGVVTEGLVDGRDVSVDGTKLDTIEVGATADQTGAEIKALYEAELDTNAYTDAEKTKLDVDTALSTTATTLPTAINELKTAVDLNTAKQTNVTTDLSYTAAVSEGTVVSSDGTDAVIPAADATNAGLMLAAEKTKLNGIETGATVDQIASEVPVTPVGNIASTNVQAAIEELDTEKVAFADAATVNLFRADKYLTAQSVANMLYTDNKLTKVRYVEDTDTDYEVLSYNIDGKLVNVAHYVATVLKGNTILSYTVGKLTSATYI